MGARGSAGASELAARTRFERRAGTRCKRWDCLIGRASGQCSRAGLGCDRRLIQPLALQ